MMHLFNSRVRVERLQLTVSGGVASMDWAQATDDDPAIAAKLAYLPCRLDLGFIRLAKDLLPAPEAGKAPDRIGLGFFERYAPIKAGDRIVAIPNPKGKIPVVGTFEIRAIPDEALDYADQHHIEVQIIETNQRLTIDNWPAEEAIEDTP